MAAKRQSGSPRKHGKRPYDAKKPAKALAEAKKPKKTSVAESASKARNRSPAKKYLKTSKANRPSVKRKAVPKAANYQPGPPDSYMHAIIKDLLSQGEETEAHIPAEAIIFSKLMVYLSMPAAEQYRSGFRLGKLYYSQVARPRPEWYEDSIPELAKFFQRLGYAVKYQVSGSRDPIIAIKSNARVDMGFDMHSFEAGIISGFLSSAKNSYIAIHESECACNWAEECLFERGQKAEAVIDKNRLMRNFARHLAAYHIKIREQRDFSWIYNAMILSTSKHVRGTVQGMHRLGEYTKREFGLDWADSRNPVRMISEIMRSVSASSSSESNSSQIRFKFDPLNSDSRYMDSLGQFASGLTGNAAKISVNLSDTGLSYTLAISFGAKLLKLNNK